LRKKYFGQKSPGDDALWFLQKKRKIAKIFFWSKYTISKYTSLVKQNLPIKSYFKITGHFREKVEK
jgi:hypothetical protein